MHPGELRKYRESYDYPAAKLIRSSRSDGLIHKDMRKYGWPELKHESHENLANHSTSIELDRFHFQLLNSTDSEDLLHGLLSVVFWGYASGTDKKLRLPWANKRSEWMITGKKNATVQPIEARLKHLSNARRYLDERRIANALSSITQVQYLGLSFGSKILAFMNPDQACVYDKIISEYLASHSQPELRVLGGATASTIGNSLEKYASWCNWCVLKASEMNALQLTWRNIDGKNHKWRSVDVERALFAHAAELRRA